MALYGSASGNNRNTGRGGYHPGATLVESDVTLTTSTGSALLSPVNGLRLDHSNVIGTPGSGSYFWQYYQGLPSYLTGTDKLCNTIVNETDSGTWTCDQACRLYMLRNTGWNAVDITGWTLQESNTSYISGYGATINVYYRDFVAGTYTYDNNSAMYIWDFASPVSNPAGGLGTTTFYGAGNTTADTSVTQFSANRSARDPWNQGALTFSVVSGSLPPGYTLNTSTGLISGTYTASGINTDGLVYTFTIRATTPSPSGLDFTDRTYTVNVSVPWLYRQIITTCYMVGGYKDNQLWNNGNRFPRATETCTNLGDGCVDNFHYKPGGCGTNRGYVLNGNSTTAFNLRTEAKITGIAAPGYAVSNAGMLFTPDRNKLYYDGEGIDDFLKFNIPTEAYSTLSTTGNNGHCSGVSGENKGLWWFGSPTTAGAAVNFATETRSTIGMIGSAHGQQKGLSAKTGFGYGSNEGDYAGGNNHRKINITAETYTTITKMKSNSGEENFVMTQDNGYMLGHYGDGGQNNTCARIVYATNAGATLATTVQGKTGASSGVGFWRD